MEPLLYIYQLNSQLSTFVVAFPAFNNVHFQATLDFPINVGVLDNFLAQKFYSIPYIQQFWTKFRSNIIYGNFVLQFLSKNKETLEI